MAITEFLGSVPNKSIGQEFATGNKDKSQLSTK